jgi:hypothetical protein
MDIVDNVIPMEEVNRLNKFFISNEWTFQTRSPTLRFQNMVLKHRGLPLIKTFPLARFPLHNASKFLHIIQNMYPDYEIEDDFVGVLMHPKDFTHTPHYDFFEDQYIGKQYQMKRILFYCVPEWKPEWGGNTEFYGRWNNEKEVPDVCQIKPNRMNVFDWDEYHTGTPWDAPIPRVVITLYLWKNTEAKIKKKIYKYVWGNAPTYSEVYPDAKPWK